MVDDATLIPGIELIHVNDVEFLDHKIVGVFFYGVFIYYEDGSIRRVNSMIDYRFIFVN